MKTTQRCIAAAFGTLLCGLALIFPTPLPSAEQTPALSLSELPVPRKDRLSEMAHADLLEKAKKGVIDIYFAGDSITRRWGATDYPELLASWKQNFFGWNAANFGWGADSIQNILWRLHNGELDGVNPKIIVLLAGTNNIGNPRSAGKNLEEKAAHIAAGIKAILKVMQTKAPDATIILTGIFPRNDRMELMPLVKLANRNLAKLADAPKVRYLNINDRLADADGRLLEGMMGDGLHPTVLGYQVWADALKPIFEEILGPPAEEDHAPPPTGVPKQ
jgi:lysophospholipase L1-like esterase